MVSQRKVASSDFRNEKNLAKILSLRPDSVTKASERGANDGNYFLARLIRLAGSEKCCRDYLHTQRKNIRVNELSRGGRYFT